MEVVKTIVGKHVENLFLENAASNILEFLELTEDRKLECAKRLMFYETMKAYMLKRNWKVSFENIRDAGARMKASQNVFIAFITKPRKQKRNKVNYKLNLKNT